MTQEQIEQAAEEYAGYTLGGGNSGNYLYDPIKNGFIAGAESRQEEIDGLKIGIAMAQDMISELKKHSK